MQWFERDETPLLAQWRYGVSLGATSQIDFHRNGRSLGHSVPRKRNFEYIVSPRTNWNKKDNRSYAKEVNNYLPKILNNSKM